MLTLRSAVCLIAIATQQVGALSAQAAAPQASTDESAIKLVESKNVPALQVADDLELDLLIKEPIVANPLYLNFDERGRLWVVQYRQYPWPAGLKLVSRDNVWRNVYSPPYPPPPPHQVDSPFRGADRISIHEDTDGDGVFDQHKVFLDGLNLATAALKGRGGVFVMNPPYLLFYADNNDDDMPDSNTPRVLLSGFGIEDTHSIANSLRWGPDGWIYGTTGSTVSASVVRHGRNNLPISTETPVHTMGQNIWRYHPEHHVYEVFAEGGGNAFGVEFDSKGRVFSGHNGGDTRGFHYVQGGFYLKNFGKHGSLSNPYAFGHYPAMQHHSVERFTHTFEIYESTELPQRYHGKLVGISPNIHYAICSEISKRGSSFQTNDLGRIIGPGSDERSNWFTPVDIQTGPDGALYIADWYSIQPNHYQNHEGQTNPDLGRIYRLKSQMAHAQLSFDLGSLSTRQLIDQALLHDNRWYRETALRLLGDRKDSSSNGRLYEIATSEHARSLDALWALNLCDGLTESVAMSLLRHPNEHVRAWIIRLLGDQNQISSEAASELCRTAERDRSAIVKLQLAATSRRLPTTQALPILSRLLTRQEDANDVFIPKMIWWGVEQHVEQRPAILNWIDSGNFWGGQLFYKSQIDVNLVRRYAMAGTHDDLIMCGQLLNRAESTKQMSRMAFGFSQAFEGRAISSLPEELLESLSKTDKSVQLVLGVRRGDTKSIDEAIKLIQDPTRSEELRASLIRAVGQVKAKPSVAASTMLGLLGEEKNDGIANHALVALQQFDQPEIATGILDVYETLTPKVRETALSVLASRDTWARNLIERIQRGDIASNAISQDTLDRLELHRDAELKQMVSSLFPDQDDQVEQIMRRIDLVEKIVRQGNGKPLSGQNLYHQKANCGKCHQMFGKGGDVGPDLTSYNRANLRAMLQAIIHPDAEIREGYENLTVLLLDGQLLSGFKIEENDKVLVLRDVNGQDHQILINEIDERMHRKTSLMPSDLLQDLSDEEIRDLFAFLTSTTPPM